MYVNYSTDLRLLLGHPVYTLLVHTVTVFTVNVVFENQRIIELCVQEVVPILCSKLLYKMGHILLGHTVVLSDRLSFLFLSVRFAVSLFSYSSIASLLRTV